MMEKCDKGYQGSCCCNCANQVILCKHPWNKPPYKGSIMDETGLYACIVFGIIDNNKKAVIFDRKHGMCEVWTEIKES